MKGVPERRRFEAGFTLIEILVCVAVVGLLTAILLPAVQHAREAARRVSCAANLKNVGVAIHQVHEAKGRFPGGEGPPLDASYIVQILPFLEQRPLFDSINMDRSRHTLIGSENATAMITKVPGFLCPSDLSRSAENFLAPPAPNYAANFGLGWEETEAGPFTEGPISASSIPDGLSQTIGIAEWVVGTGLHKGMGDPRDGDRLGSVFDLGSLGGPASQAKFVSECTSLSSPEVRLCTPGFKGAGWLRSGLPITQYNHVLTPGRPSCLGATANMRAYTSGSRHGAGGAHVVVMDGSVRFITSSIALPVWRALGTRGGGEAIAANAF